MTMSLSRAVVLFAGALALTVGVAKAQDPVGTWNTKMDFGGNAVEATMTITRGADGALSGTWTGAQGESALASVKFEDGTLSFTRNVSFNANSFALTFEGEIDGDNLTGAFITDFGELAITGTRAVPETAALVGTWNGSSSTAQGEQTFKLVINADLTGTIESEQGTLPVRNIALKDGQLTYAIAIDFGGESFEIMFAGKLEGSTITGGYSVPSFGEVAQVTAVKLEVADMAVMVGTWEMTAETEAGQQQTSMVVNADFSGTVSFGEFGSFPLDYIEIREDDELWWGIAATIQDNQVYIEFAGKLDGEKFTGGIWVGDQEVARITGTKKN